MAKCDIQPLDQTLRKDVLQMIARAFASDDPLARSQGIGEAEFHELIDRLYDPFVADRLSFVAIDSDADRVAAVILAEPHREEAGNEGSDAISAIIATARESYFADRHPAIGELMHIHFIASDPDYRRQKLVAQLTASCLQRGREQGFGKVMVEASGIRSRKLFEEHLDFQPRVTVSYADYEYRGDCPFRAIAEHGGLTLMDKLL